MRLDLSNVFDWKFAVLAGGIVVASVGLVALPFYLAYRVSKKPKPVAGLGRARRRR